MNNFPDLSTVFDRYEEFIAARSVLRSRQGNGQPYTRALEMHNQAELIFEQTVETYNTELRDWIKDAISASK